MPTVTGRALWVPLLTLLGLAALAFLAYAPALFLPFISDDYIQIAVAREFGPPSKWADLAEHPLYRFRAVSLVMSYYTEAIFGLLPGPFHLSSLFLHIVSVWAVAALGLWKPIGWSVSIPAAAFFAIAEGHQEAVIWYAALPELNVFLFVVGAFLCWLKWLETGGTSWYGAGLLSFCLALLSKESAVALAGLQLLAMAAGNHWRRWPGLLPFAGVAALYFAIIYSTRDNHLHFADGTFSLSAPFWQVITNSLVRMLWIWGFVALGLLLWLRRSAALPISGIALGWAVVGLAPYSFLTYMSRVPSRHTYLASVALAILVGAALNACRDKQLNRRLAASLAVVMLTHNVAYLWLHKTDQFRQRAEVTETLIELASRTDKPIRIECFPYSRYIAIEALRVRAGISPERLVFDHEGKCTDNYRYHLVGSQDSPALVR